MGGRAWALLVFALAAASGCNKAPGDACSGAGGTCLEATGMSICAQVGPASDQDCPNSPPGVFCCLVFSDGAAPAGDAGLDGAGGD